MSMKKSVSKIERVCHRCLGTISVGRSHWYQTTTHMVELYNDQTGISYLKSENVRHNYHVRGECNDQKK
jgi:hypothetical protein